MAGLRPCLLALDRLIPADDAPHTYQVLWRLRLTLRDGAALNLDERDFVGWPSE